jgi:HSP20 family protein
MAMALRRFSPWSSFTELQRESEQLMRSMLGGLGLFGAAPALASAGSGEEGPGWMPAIDIVTRDNDVIVRAELPGIDPEKDLDISVHDGMLTIRGERRHEDRQDNDTYVRVERRYGAFERTLALPEGVNGEDIQAQYRDGVLQVVIPGAAQVASVRKVPVQIANGATKTIEAEAPSQPGSPATG